MNQEKVFAAVSKIPKGRVASYKAVARLSGIKSCRAIGQILKSNKHPDKIPCYRVVCSDGSVGGYNLSQKEKIRRLFADGIEIKNGKVDGKYLIKD